MLWSIMFRIFIENFLFKILYKIVGGRHMQKNLEILLKNKASSHRLVKSSPDFIFFFKSGLGFGFRLLNKPGNSTRPCLLNYMLCSNSFNIRVASGKIKNYYLISAFKKMTRHN
ncbi:hypothetical protein BpHYR1_002834 [Brachionus plicatilis]|uniref:Uncharacterized protein n=1 Tax=Brachionus plicatilis TaxID=10195 RepID=A0A3M7SE35_BRAPC|nr:hypothetical protein BpHYR1_002834 [Brachionus plicatilis]